MYLKDPKAVKTDPYVFSLVLLQFKQQVEIRMQFECATTSRQTTKKALYPIHYADVLLLLPR